MYKLIFGILKFFAELKNSCCKKAHQPLEFEFFLIFLVKFEFYFVVKNEPSIFRISRALLMRDVIASSFTFTFTVSLAFALAKELKNLNFVNDI